MNQRSKSTLFLMEQLVVIAVFAICASACVRILSSAYLNARNSNDVNNAIKIAESGAECFKAVAGDIAKTAEILVGEAAKADGGIGKEGISAEATVYYDKHWQVCGKDGAYYVFCLTNGNLEPSSPLLVSGEILVKRISGESLIAFNTAVCSNIRGRG